MAQIPEGAVLIDNPTGGPQGFRIGNVHVMAGIPSIMQAMLSSLEHELRHGDIVSSCSVTAYLGESQIAAAFSAVQQRYPGAAVDAETRELRWTGAQDVTTLGYGGCVDLGSVITQTRQQPAKSGEQEVIARALALAERYWTPGLISSGSVATDVLRKSLGKQKWKRVLEPDQVRYVFKDSTYSVLQITHRYADGQDMVRVEWVGNF